MKRIVTPMVGGMVTSSILTLIVIPVIYEMWRGWQMRLAPATHETAPEDAIRI